MHRERNVGLLEPPTSSRRLWLFSAPVDLAVFLGSALIALAALPLGAHLGLLHGRDTTAPEWTWVTAVLLIDVAHVWATGFRIYLDGSEFRRRLGLYTLVPLLCFLLGVVVYTFLGSLLFWRCLAYIAVFHFVRQQYGWVALYRARTGERDRPGYWIDTLAIYLAMLYPLLYWHAHLPRRFHWFLEGDFQQIPPLLALIAQPVYWGVLALYACRSAYLWLAQRPNPGKDIVVATTAICWHVGIITFNSDYAFTVTNVIIHGIPYMALVYWYWMHQRVWEKSRRRHLPAILVFVWTIWLLAYIEEMLWDRGVWHDRSWLFGEGWSLPPEVHLILVPLLATPQLTHYVLDGFIWKRKHNPGVARAFSE